MGKLKRVLSSIFVFAIIVICFTFFDTKKDVPNSSSLEKFTEQVLALYREYNTDTSGYKEEISYDDLEMVGSDYMISTRLLSNRFGVEIEVDDSLASGNVVKLSSNNRDTLPNEEVVYLKSGDMLYKGGEKLFALEAISNALGYEVTYTSDVARLTRPYFTKRLYLKTTSQIDYMGAVASISGYDDMVVLQYASEEDTERAYLSYNQNPEIEYVDIDFIVEVEDTEAKSFSTSSTYSYTSWGGDAMGIGSYTDNLISTLTANGKELEDGIVAVLDTGIDTDHSWFTGRIADGGKDYTDTTSTTSYAYEDDHAHGTHVSGIICDLTQDNISILPLKVLNYKGEGYSLGIFNAMKYVLELVESGTNITVMNMSLGGTHSIGDDTWDTYNAVVTSLNSYGVPTIAAAGNDGIDVVGVSPANINSAITVTAVGIEDENYYRPSWSNYGTYVDVTAPGVDVISAYMGGGMAYMSGTSMAAPHIAAAIALMKSDPDANYTYAEIELILDNNAIDLGNSGWDIYYGEGLVSLEYAYAKLLDSSIVFSRTNTECTDAFELTLSIADSDAKIYYTLDGSVPNQSNGTLYTNSIHIDTTTLVRAVAFVFDDSGNVEKYSRVSSITYTFGTEDVAGSYVVDENGVLTAYKGILKELTVPSEVDGITVVSIGSGAFTDTTVVSVILPETITTIDDEAFISCTTIETVIAPSVTSIGESAFEGCIKYGTLTDDEFPVLTSIGDYAFYGCYSLNDITLSSVTTIGDCAFYMGSSSATQLRGVSLPSVTSLGAYAFFNCEYVNTVILDSLTIVPNSAFMYANIKNLSLPEAEYIGSYAFYHNTSMQTVELPKVEFIGMSAFNYDSSDTSETASNEIMSLTLPKLKYIGVYAFPSAKALESITAPNLEYIGRGALSDCTSLSSISTDKLRIVGEDTFENCTALLDVDLPVAIEIRANAFNGAGLERISISSAIQYIGYGALNVVNTTNLVVQMYRGASIAEDYVIDNGLNYTYLDGEYTYLTYQTINSSTITISGINPYVETPSNVVIPEYLGGYNLPVTVIGEGAFKGCTSVINLVSSTIQTVEAEAFYLCTGLKYVYLDNVTFVGSSAFYRCEALDSVTMPNIETIDMRAFYGCNSLYEITLNDSISSIGFEALAYGSNGVVNTDFVIYYDGQTIPSVISTYTETYGIQYAIRYGSVGSLWYRTWVNGSTTEAEVAKIDRNKTGSITLPQTIGDYTLTRIGEDALADCAFITGVYLPETVRYVSTGAFEGCVSLEEINLDNIETIGTYAFRFCTSLREVNIPLVTSVSSYAFYGCVNLEKVSMSSATYVGVSSFDFCENLQVVECPNLTTVSAYSFYGNSRLHTIDTYALQTIGSSATTMYSFGKCYSLKSVYLPNVVNIALTAFNTSGVERLVIGKSFTAYTDTTYSMDTDIDIYGYSGSTIETYATSNGNDFYPIDELGFNANLPETKTCIEGMTITLEVEAIGYDLKYQWYQTTTPSGSVKFIVDGETSNSLQISPSEVGNLYYYVQVSDWTGSVITSNICNIEVVSELAYYSISAEDGERYTVSLAYASGETLPLVIAEGDTINADLMMMFVANVGYSLDTIYIKGDDGSIVEIDCMEDGNYCGLRGFHPLEGVAITQNYVIYATTVPRSTTDYEVWHYKEVLVASTTSVEKDGLYYELDMVEELKGTTETQTNAQANAYTGYSALSFSQKTILADGSQIVEIYYERNFYTLTLEGDAGVAGVTGTGRYKFGTSVNISATLATGYNWVQWTSANTDILANISEQGASVVVPMSDIVLTATSALKTFTITVIADSGCVITPSDTPIVVEFGTNHTITFSAIENYKIVSIILNGSAIDVTANYRIRSIDKDYTFEVTSEKKKVVINIETNIVGMSDSISVEIGSPYTYEVPKRDGYDIHAVYVNGSQVEMVDGKIELEVVSEDLEIEVLYSEIRNSSGGESGSEETDNSNNSSSNNQEEQNNSSNSDNKDNNDEGLNINPVIIAGVVLLALFVISIGAVVVKMISRSRRL